MKSRPGSALAVVLVVTMAVGVVAAAFVSLISTQRKLAIAKELQLQANNVAETAIDYAYSYIVYDLMANGKSSTTYVPATGYKEVTFSTAVQTYLSGAVPNPSGFTGSTSQVTFSDLSVRVLAKPSSTPVRYFVDGNDPANVDHKGKNLWVEELTIPIIARVKAKLGNRTYTAYLRKDIADMAVPGFQHAIFYEMQLQVHRGYPILGSVHTNADLLLNAHSGDTAQYNGSVTCHGHFYRGSTIDAGGSGADPYGFTPIVANNGGLDFAYVGESVSPYGTNSTTLTILSKTKPSVAYETLATDFDCRKSNWKTEAVTKFGGYLADIAHDVPALTLPGGKGYQQDVAGTPATNEFSNLPYALIEPVLPTGHASKKSKDIQFNNLNANASLILRIESTAQVVANGTSPKPAGSIFEDELIANPGTYLCVKGYKYADLTVEPWERDPATESNLSPVSLPKNVLGVCNKVLAAFTLGITTGTDCKFDKYNYNTGTNLVDQGMHDARLGRGVNVITLDVAKLKTVMEAAYSTLTDNADKAFRLSFNVLGDDWKRAVIYVQFPTDLVTNTAKSLNPNTTNPATGGSRIYGAVDATDTYRFNYGTAETRHPNRWADTDNHGRQPRTDKIVPLAKMFRGYPTTYTDTELRKVQWAIPALQVINAKSLPNPSGSKGFSIATNGPLYLVGSYNSDGNIATKTNLWSTAPDAYAEGDTGAVPSMIMCDMLTFLSDDWYGLGNWTRSYPGGDNDAWDYRKVVTGPVEIDACIATGGYPVFEFFAHTLESWVDFYNKSSYPNPIVIKGSMVAEWESEIQHIKQAYSRDVNNDIQVYWNAHGAYGIPAVRFHKRNMDGTEIPGAPYTPIYDQKSFRLLRRGDAADGPVLTSAGF